MLLSKRIKRIGAVVIGASLSFAGTPRPAEAAAGPAGQLPSYSTVSTLTVRGVRMSMPSGLVFDAKGTLYVSDGAENVIYAVDPTGNGRVVAGVPTLPDALLPGGFADGPVSSARFYRPMGLALDATGRLLVADEFNHCVRSVGDGVVTTLAGTCGVSGDANGPARSASFKRPVAVAVDATGDVYVADYGTGVRKIDTHANVSLTYAAPCLTGLSLGSGMLWATDERAGIIQIPISEQAHAALRILGNGSPGDIVVHENATGVHLPGLRPRIDGDEFAGYPYAVLGLGVYDALSTDARMENVRFLHLDHTRVVAGSADVDADLEGTGLVDGVGKAARFNLPLAIAQAPDGSFVIADAGNHALRRLSPVDREIPFPPGSTDPGFAPGEYKIGLVGNSYVWTLTDGPSSVQHALEYGISDSRALAAAKLKPHVVSFAWYGSKLDAFVKSIREFVIDEHFDTLVLLLNTATIPGDAPAETIAAWRPAVLSQLAELRKISHDSGIPILVAVHPTPAELAPWETYSSAGLGLPHPGSIAALAGVIAESGIPMIDLTPAMLADEFKSDHQAIFGSYDGHFSPYGRNFVGKLIAAEIVRRAPWTVSSK